MWAVASYVSYWVQQVALLIAVYQGNRSDSRRRTRKRRSLAVAILPEPAGLWDSPAPRHRLSEGQGAKVHI